MAGIKNLLENEHALITLCFIGEKLKISGLPSFIDSGAICDWLIKKGLVKNRTPKHLHIRPCIISKFGKRILKRLENRGIIDILNKCRFDDVENFLTDFNNHISVINQKSSIQYHYPMDSTFDHFPRMQKWHQTRLGIQYFVEKCEKVNETNHKIYLKIICPVCREESVHSYILDKLDRFWSKFLDFTCNICNNTFEHNYYLTIWRRKCSSVSIAN
ncbi:MAG: hypothetical protein ACFFB5_01915 [Promethearchaeota archaeon]